MKPRLVFITALAALVTSGCGQKDTSTQAAAAPAGPRVIEITAGDTMKYDVTAIEAKPGEDLKVILTNNGTQPVAVMGHNWVLLKAGTDVAAFDAVIAHIDLLGPRKSGEVDFKAPAAPGEYPYLCTFPAHYQAGMKGVLTVK
jgi:azurin